VHMLHFFILRTPCHRESGIGISTNIQGRISSTVTNRFAISHTGKAVSEEITSCHFFVLQVFGHIFSMKGPPSRGKTKARLVSGLIYFGIRLFMCCQAQAHLRRPACRRSFCFYQSAATPLLICASSSLFRIALNLKHEGGLAC